MQKFKNLFLRQSYLDSYEEYEKSIKKDKYPLWDYIVLTASNEAQADFYRLQIDARLRDGKLPKKTHYAVLPDPDGKRVGSGGATLNVLKYIAKHRACNDFTGLKILCIHSGGDSKRVPQYSACGKLFSPVPRKLADGRRSTLFDEFIFGMTGVPARMGDGMLVCSGDVLLLFNPLQLDFYTKGAMALSIKENVETGKNHGVFLGNKDGNVARFLHKQSVESLTKNGAVDNNCNVNIDTGAVIFGGSLLNDLYSLVDNDEKFDAYVNEHVRLSFYADFLYPLAEESTLENFYKEIPEGDFSPELSVCRKAIWDKLHTYKMRLLQFSPASFIHFGTTKELLKLMTEEISEFSYLSWSSDVNCNSFGPSDGKIACSNSYINHNPSTIIGEGSYIEDSYIHKGTKVGKGCVISGVTLDGQSIPDNVVLHGLKLKDGSFVVRMYDVDDNPKNCIHMGNSLSEPLWTAKLFTPAKTMKEAVENTLNGVVNETSLSLSESFNMADTAAIPMWQSKLDDRVKVELVLNYIEYRAPAEELKCVFENGLPARVSDKLLEIAEKLDESKLDDFSTKIRIYYYLATIVGRDTENGEKYLKMCFDTIGSALEGVYRCNYNSDLKIIKSEAEISLPVRVNFGGGWTDTPPYCNENGGSVLNAALILNGELPIKTKIKKTDTSSIILASEDNGTYKEFTSLDELVYCKNPSDPFALHKAALISFGVIPKDSTGYSLEEILKRLGSGLYLSTQAINIPRGSGLGTSSILSASCIKALSEFFGSNLSSDQIYDRVMLMEQLMSTGGGWQDQVGGLSLGFKMITSAPGLNQYLKCERLELGKDALCELNNRFAIIYTGQRRLARNLLREVVGKYIGSDPYTLEAFCAITELSEKMHKCLKNQDVDALAELMNEHWEQSKKLDSGSTNTCIDQIFISVDDLVDGKMICGAGGGGFLQVILKKGVTKQKLKQRLDSVFSGAGVIVWDGEFYI